MNTRIERVKLAIAVLLLLLVFGFASTLDYQDAVTGERRAAMQ